MCQYRIHDDGIGHGLAAPVGYVVEEGWRHGVARFPPPEWIRISLKPLLRRRNPQTLRRRICALATDTAPGHRNCRCLETTAVHRTSLSSHRAKLKPRSLNSPATFIAGVSTDQGGDAQPLAPQAQRPWFVLSESSTDYSRSLRITTSFRLLVESVRFRTVRGRQPLPVAASISQPRDASLPLNPDHR